MVVLMPSASSTEQGGRQDLSGICLTAVALLGAGLVLQLLRYCWQAGELLKLFSSRHVWGEGLKPARCV